MPPFRPYCRLLSLLLLVAGVCAPFAARAQQPSYDRALRLRAALDATPPQDRTPAQYTQVLNAFRAVYHADRATPNSGASVEAVAELLAGEGRVFHDPSLLRAAVEQLDFLRRDFAATPFAESALMTEGEIELRDLADRASAEARFTEFLRDYPDSPLARQARTELRQLGVAVPSPREMTSVGRTPVAQAQAPALPRQSQLAAPVEPRVASGLSPQQVRPGANTPSTQAAAAPPSTGLWAPPVASEDDSSAASSQPALRVGNVPVYRTRRRSAPSGRLVPVNGIRHWSTANYTRVVVDLGSEVPFEASRVSDPDRIFFDFHGARLAPDLAGRAVTVNDGGFLERIRAAQFSNDVVRVVLDVTNVSEYSAFWLPNPSRLIIDIHGRPPGAPPPEYASAAAVNQQELQSSRGAEVARREPAPNLREDDVPAPTAGSSSRSLPPSSMAADASGRLSPAAAAVRAGAPQTRAARAGAPNTFVAQTAAPGAAASPPPRAGDSVAAIAALSQQPTRVRATAEPTLAPVASGEPAETASAAVPAARHHARRQPLETPSEVPAVQARAAEPDALGGRSMVRALGLKINRIVIDAGHGGHDSGTLGPGGIEEKNVVLDVALRLGKLLKQRLGADVIYTRDDDTFIPLETRTAIANKAQADLFISIHANSSSDPDVRGVETYYLNFTTSADALAVAARENAVSDESIHQLSDLVKKIAMEDKIEESREFASDVEESLYHGLEAGNPGLKDRGVKKAPFVVLIGANMPSILAEISFLTNPRSADELRDPAYRERIAEALYRGVAEYVRSLSSVPTQESADRDGSRIK